MSPAYRETWFGTEEVAKVRLARAMQRGVVGRVLMRTVRSFFACAAMSVSACIPSISAPDARVADALIQEAIEAGGREDPSASYYLALAERELSRARVLLRVHDAEGAKSWARRARADAEVARLCAIEIAARDAARRSEADAMEMERKLEGKPLLLAPARIPGVESAEVR